jgi:hypothetical protein
MSSICESERFSSRLRHHEHHIAAFEIWQLFIVERRLKGRHDLRLRVVGHHHPRPQIGDRQYRSRSLAIQAFGTSHLRVPELRRVKLRHPASFHHTDKPVLSLDNCFIALPSEDQDRRGAGYGIGSGAPRQQNLSIPFHQVLVDRRHFRIFIRLCRRLQQCLSRQLEI